jgi:hypothetical protein
MSSRLNALHVADQPMLLTRTATGTAIHLATEAATTDARAAKPDRVNRSRGTPADELLDTRWSPVALCGRPWTVMADDFADHTGRVVERPEAPTCRQCLAVIDKAFPTPVPDSRIGVLADLAATAVNDHGTAEIVGVPGDQMNALRGAIRTELRQRFGFCTRTFTQDGLLVVSSPETRHLIEQTAVRAMADLDLDDRTKVDDSGWRFHWTAWSVS